MAVMDWIELHRETLAWLGTGVATIAGGVWTVVRWLRPTPAPRSSDTASEASSTSSPTPPAPSSPSYPSTPATELQLDLDEAVSRFLEAPRHDGLDLKAPGLAVAYYYNFLEVISREIKSGRFRLTNENRKINSENFQIQVILPRRLDAHTFQTCEQELNKTSKGSTYIEGQKKVYGINYRLNQMNNDGTAIITIVDLAPVIALKRYYEDIARIETAADDPRSPQWLKWEEIQRTEIAAFRKTLEKIMVRGFGELANRLDIIARG